MITLTEEKQEVVKNTSAKVSKDGAAICFKAWVNGRTEFWQGQSGFLNGRYVELLTDHMAIPVRQGMGLPKNADCVIAQEDFDLILGKVIIKENVVLQKDI